MQKRPFPGVFLVVLLISIAIFIFAKAGLLKPLEPLTQILLSPIQASVYKGFNAFTSVFSNSKLTSLQNQNAALTKQLVDQNRLMQDNKALRDQFETTGIITASLIPAQVVGAPGFLPGFSLPENYIIDKGEADGVAVGDAVVYKDNLVGRVTKTTQYLSSVQLVSNAASSFTATTLATNALGVIKGQGGGNLILDNVVLSDTLKVGDVVISKGSINVSGAGMEPDLVVGKITAISKNPSDLFQRAKLQSLIDFSHLDTVFVVSRR